MERTPKLRLLSAFLALAMLLTMLPTAAFALYTGYGEEGNFTVDGLNYQVNTADTDTVTLVGSKKGLTSVDIPSNVPYGNTTYTVTAIGDTPFNTSQGGNSFNRALTSVSIPSTVTSIGWRAFYLCNSLTSIEIPNSVTSIGDQAFACCTGLISIEIPNRVTSIGDNAFQGCTGLTSINIPDGVTSIGESAFSGCEKLTSVKIPNSVIRIGDWAFSSAGLTSIEIPNRVTSIGNYAFSSCKNLKSVEIPNSVTSIGDWAFYDCAILDNVYIPDSVTRIGVSSFQGCTNLNDVKYNGYRSKWDVLKKNIGYGNDAILNAKYLCDVIFNLDGGKIGDADTFTQTIYSNDTVNLSEAKLYDPKTKRAGETFTIPTPTKEGYTFTGWSDDETNTCYTNGDLNTYKVVKDKTSFTAHWTLNQHKVTVKQDENDPNPTITENVNYGTKFEVNTPDERSGYKFNGWKLTDSNGKNVQYLTERDNDSKYSFTMPDYDVVATAQWTKNGDLDTGNFTFKAPDNLVEDGNEKIATVTPADGVNIPQDNITIHYYDKTTGKELTDNGAPKAPTKAGTYVVKITVKDAEGYNDIVEPIGKDDWTFTVVKKQEPAKPDDKPTPRPDEKPATYTVTVENGTAYDGETAKNNFKKGDIVTVKVNEEALKEMDFDKWEVVKGDVKLADINAPETTFEMPAENVELKAVLKVKAPEEPDKKGPNAASIIAGAGVAVIGGAALGWQAYNLYAELAGYWMLPSGFAFPANRELLALALWNDADQPAAVNTTKYSDIDEDNSESQTAARWAVENELIKPLDDEDTAFGAALPVGPLEVYKAFKAEKAWQKANK